MSSYDRCMRILDQVDALLSTIPPKVDGDTEKADIDSDYIKAIEASDKTQNRQEILPHKFVFFLNEQLPSRTTRNGFSSKESIGTTSFFKMCSIGCGDGLLDSRIIANILKAPQVHIDYTGIDITPQFLQEARKRLLDMKRDRLNFEVIQRNCEHDNLATCGLGQFDLVYSVHMIYYITDLSRVVDNMLSLVRPGGTVVFIGLNNEGLTSLRRLLWKHEDRHWYWTSNDVMTLLDSRCIQYEKHTIVPTQDITEQIKEDFASSLSHGVLDFACQTKMRWYNEDAVHLCREYLKTAALGNQTQDGRAIINHPTDFIIIKDYTNHTCI